jgi:hypothetical protein
MGGGLGEERGEWKKKHMVLWHGARCALVPERCEPIGQVRDQRRDASIGTFWWPFEDPWTYAAKAQR